MRTTSIALPAATALFTAPLSAQRAQPRPLGEVDFFGSKGVDVAAVRAALSFHVGEQFPPAGVHADPLKRQVSDIVKQITGRPGGAAVMRENRQVPFLGAPGTTLQRL